MKRLELPRGKLSPAPPAPGAMRIAKPAACPVPVEVRRDPGQVYGARVPADVAAIMVEWAKKR
jgi:hypothetical protein